MAIASLVLGIISIILSMIPFCSLFSILPAIVGLILGIVDVVKKRKNGGKKGMSITGIVLSGIAIVIMTVWLVASMGIMFYNDEVLIDSLDMYGALY